MMKRFAFLCLFFFTSVLCQWDNTFAVSDPKNTIENSFDGRIHLTEEEEKWLEQNHVVRTRVGDNPPLHYNDGQNRGVSVEYLNLIAEKVGFQVEYVYGIPWPDALENIKKQETVDLLLTAKNVKERRRHMRFSDDYLLMPWVIFSRTDSTFISSIDDLIGKTVAVEKGYVMQNRLMSEFPGINLLVKNSPIETLQAVASNEADAYIGNLAISTYIIHKYNLTNLKVASPTPFDNHNQAFVVRNDWPELVSILNKVIKATSGNELSQLRNKWFNVKFEYGLSKTVFIKWIFIVTGICLLILLFFSTWIFSLRVQIKKRKKAEEKFRALFEQAGGYCMILDPNTSDGIPEIIDANKAACDVHGYTREEFIGRPVNDIDDEDGKRLVKKRTAEIMTGEPFYVENKHVRKDGTSFSVAVNAKRIDVGDGRSLILTTEYDITERKLGEKKLIEKEKKYRDLIDSSPDLHYRTDTEGRIVFISLSAKKISGYTVEELIGMKIEEFYVNGEERKGLLASLQKNGSVTEYESQLKRKDGSVWWASTNAHFFKNNDGDILGVEGVTRDVTERKEAEQTTEKAYNLLKTAEKMANIGSWEWDIQKDKFIMSDEWLRIHGVKNSNITMTELMAIAHPDDEKAIERNFKDALDGIRPYNITHRITRQANGDERVVHAKGVVSHDKEGNPCMVLGTTQDVTDRKQAEDEKLNLEAQLHQSLKMESIGTLAGGIAHDFNNILSAVIGFTELALGAVEKKSPIEDDLHEVYAAGLRAKDLVQQILTFARQSDEKRNPIQVDLIIKEVIKFIRSSTPTTIEIKQNIESDSLIMGNSTQIHQIMMNLCTNAAQSMENNGGILEITLKDITIDRGNTLGEEYLKSGGYIEIIVSDTGDGIAPQIIDKIFDPYFTTKGPGEGTGMGLALVHGIIESYSGKIIAESRLGEGTVFNIYLPVARKSKVHQQYKVEGLPTGQERILFVDDEAQIAKMASRILGQLGYSVTARTSSVEALELFRSKPNDFDMVISDVTMPKMTGDQLTQKLIEIRPDIPVILCTGYSKKLSEEKTLEIGVKAFAYKPILKEDLAKTVRDVLDLVKD